MAWIEVHQALITHRKLKALARALKVRRAVALGHLVCLWCWCLDNAPDGDLTDIDERDIQEAADWPRKPSVLLEAMVATGFLDDTAGKLTIHDWDDYAGRLLSKRAANAERMRRARADERASHVQGLPTVPNQPAQNSTSTSTAPPQPPLPLGVDPYDLQRAVDAFDRQSPMGVLPDIHQQLQDWLEEKIPVEWIERACLEAAESGGRKPIKFVRSIIERYVRQNNTDDMRAKANGQPSATDPERAEYLAAKSRGTNSGAGLVVFTASDEATIHRYEAKQREAQHA